MTDQSYAGRTGIFSRRATQRDRGHTCRPHPPEAECTSTVLPLPRSPSAFMPYLRTHLHVSYRRTLAAIERDERVTVSSV
eukprot:1183343-Prorocentrum_minimum.AAC.3